MKAVDFGKSKRSFRGIWLWLLVGLFVADSLCHAQTQGSVYNEDSSDAPVSSEEDPVIPVPVRGGIVGPYEYDTAARSLGAQTFRDDVFLNRRNRYGFALNFNQGYIEDLPTDQSSGMTAAFGQAFVNFAKRRSNLHVNFGGGYRAFPEWDFQSPEAHAEVQYSYRLAKPTSFRFFDRYSTGYNDFWEFNSMYSRSANDPDLSNEVIYNLQRITRNNFRAGLYHEIGRRINLGVFGGHQYQRYAQENLAGRNDFLLGGNFDIRLTGWLYLTNDYTLYLPVNDRETKDARIHRLRASGLDFRFGGWRIWGGAGVEYTNYSGRHRIGFSGNAGAAYTSMNTAFSLTYQRGFTSPIGISTLLQSEIVAINLGHRFSRWMYSRLSGSYSGSADQIYYGVLETYRARATIQFALTANIQLLLNGRYNLQKTTNFFIEGLGIERLSADIGLQYVWPKGRR